MTKLKIHTQLQFGEEVIAEGSIDDIQSSILKMISYLPEESQNAFYLTVVHGMSDVEVGQLLNCPAERVRGWMEEAVRWIQENVERIRGEM